MNMISKSFSAVHKLNDDELDRVHGVHELNDQGLDQVHGGTSFFMASVVYGATKGEYDAVMGH
jgi:hypothetical protein